MSKAKYLAVDLSAPVSVGSEGSGVLPVFVAEGLLDFHEAAAVTKLLIVRPAAFPWQTGAPRRKPTSSCPNETISHRLGFLQHLINFRG